MAPKTKKGNKAQGSVSQLSEEFAATNLENDEDDGKSAAKDSAKKPDSVDEPVTRESRQDQDPFRFLLPKLADSARALSAEHPLYKKVVEYAGNLVAVADWESFKTDFLEPCLPNRPGLVRQLIFVVTENDHHLGHLLFQLLAHLLPPQDEKHDDEDEDEDEGANDVFPSPDALGGFAWAKVLRACEVQHFHPLVMYKPTYYTDVKTENPITAFFWCPVAASIVGEDIMSATPNAHAIQNFQNILRDYPELKARLISVRNLNPSLCHEYWPSRDPFEDRRPEVYKAQIDQACNEMAHYMNVNRVPSLENTSYLIMCGDYKMKNEANQVVKTENFVRGYLAKKFPPKPNPSPRLVVCGHPTYYFKSAGIPVLAKMLGVKPQAEGLDAKPKNILLSDK